MKARVGYAALVAVIALAIGYGAERHLFSGLSFDALLTLRHAALGDRHRDRDGPVIVVTIEESTFGAPGFRDVPWALWGPQFATVLDALDRAEAKVIGLDVIFASTAEAVVPGRDRPLMEVLRRLAESSRIVLAQTDAGGRVLGPHPIFGFLVGHQKTVRSANVSIGRDGIVRSMPLWQASVDPSAGAEVPAFALTVAQRAGFDLAQLPPELRRLAPNFGDAAVAPTFAMEDVFACAGDVGALKAAIAGKVVLIGGALDIEDRKAVSGRFFLSAAGEPRRLPCASRRASDGGKRRTVPGVFIHAQAVSDLLRWELARSWPDWAVLLAVAMMSAAGSGLAVVLRAPAAGLSLGGALTAWGAVAIWSASLDWFAPLLGVMTSGAAAFVIGISLRNFVIDRERRRIALALSRYLDFRLARQLMASDKPLELGGETREITIWFSDIVGFSTLAERMDAKELVGRLNRHFSLVAEAVEAEGGIVDKYVGDSVVAIFGAPAELPDHAARAMRAALVVRDRIEAEAGAPGVFRIRIGLNSGRCVVGNVGSHRRFDYTAIGDTVNVGQRLEAASKELGTVILASEATVQAAGPAFNVRHLGSIPVKGRAQPVTAYEVLDLNGAGSIGAGLATLPRSADSPLGAEARGGGMISRLCAFLCVLTILALTGLPAAASEPRVALIIGNSEYGPAIGKLKNPVNDAKLMAETLKGLGFSVELVLDADQKAMKRAVKSFGAKLREAGSEATGLFYYAGHGVQVEGTNFLLPVGAEIEAEADVEIESIAADDVMTQMQSAGNAVNLVFLDACRNNPLARTSRSATRGLARLDAPRGSFVGYSTAPGDVAADGDGANSPYALALAEELRKPGISIEEAHRNVRSRVLVESGNKQTPWDSSSLTGAVVLVEKAPEPEPQAVAQAAPASQPQVQQQASVDKEVVFWQSIKNSTNPEEFEAYLKKYPDGTFADLVRAKLANLPASSAPNSSAIQQAAVEADDPNHVSPLSDGTIVLSKRVAADLEMYRQPRKDLGYFFVSLDGKSSGNEWCKSIDYSCWSKVKGSQAEMPRTARNLALTRCRTNAKTECVMLFHIDTEKRSYKVVGAQ